MAADFEKNKSEWRPISELRAIEQDISSLGYVKEYIKANKLRKKKTPRVSSSSGQVDFLEPLEVKEEGGEVFYRENDHHEYAGVPETFETQYGTFINHYNGEFSSWLGKEGYDGFSEEEKERYRFLGWDDYYIEGNYCDMFDCGEYSYAISNILHMGLGWFKIVRIDKNLEAVIMYDNSGVRGWFSLEYMGRFQNEKGYILIVSGMEELKREQNEKRNFQDKTILFQIDSDGKCSISKEWKIQISSPNNMAVAGDFIYFGQNRMVTRLNMISGELTYFTNKNDDELAALKHFD